MFSVNKPRALVALFLTLFRVIALQPVRLYKSALAPARAAQSYAVQLSTALLAAPVCNEPCCRGGCDENCQAPCCRGKSSQCCENPACRGCCCNPRCASCGPECTEPCCI